MVELRFVKELDDTEAYFRLQSAEIGDYIMSRKQRLRQLSASILFCCVVQ